MILICVGGLTGVPLVYVVRHQLILEEEDDDPCFGEANTKFFSLDQEMNACSPLPNGADLDLTYNRLEANDPFVLPFLTDLKKVWAILHAMFSASGVWQHVKKYTTAQNGHHVWRTLHTNFFGGDKVNTMYNDIIMTLRNLFYNDNHKN